MVTQEVNDISEGRDECAFINSPLQLLLASSVNCSSSRRKKMYEQNLLKLSRVKIETAIWNTQCKTHQKVSKIEIWQANTITSFLICLKCQARLEPHVMVSAVVHARFEIVNNKKNPLNCYIQICFCFRRSTLTQYQRVHFRKEFWLPHVDLIQGKSDKTIRTMANKLVEEIMRELLPLLKLFSGLLFQIHMRRRKENKLKQTQYFPSVWLWNQQWEN